MVCEEVIDSDNSFNFNGYDSDQDPEYNIIFSTTEQNVQGSDSFDPVDIDESTTSHVSKIL